jgi:choline dehydrogenase-like flavoprotein
VPNLLICDGSVMPTQGAANPALTIMALASRLAERLGDKRITGRGHIPARRVRQGAARS